MNHRPIERIYFPLLASVADFQEKFGIPMPAGPTALTPDLHTFRVGFMQEELDEYKKAHLEGDLEGQLDALIDLTYVVLGTALMQGFWLFQEGFARVHAANMKKVAGVSTNRHRTHDITKPEGWTPPDLSDLVDPNQFKLGL